MLEKNRSLLHRIVRNSARLKVACSRALQSSFHTRDDSHYRDSQNWTGIMKLRVISPVALGLLQLFASPATSQSATCGSCTAPGACPPTLPFAGGVGLDHGCEDWDGHVAPFSILAVSNFAEASLDNANISASLLFEVNLDGASMSGIDLSGSFLDRVTLVDADLSGANLSSLDTRDVCFLQADLSGAEFEQAYLDRSDFSGADLSNASNLDTTTFFLEAPKYDCDTDFSGTGFDPVAANWTKVGSLCGNVLPMGCSTSQDTIPLLAGEPKLGTTLTLGLDDPFGASMPGSTALLLIANQPDPAFPCGSIIPGFGMQYYFGEVLISAAPPNPLLVLVGNTPWTTPGNPVPVDLPIPANPNLASVELFVQGVLAAPGDSKLTAGKKLILTP